MDWNNVTEARRTFWRRLSGRISGVEVHEAVETYEHENDDQKEFGKASYHRK